MTWEQLVVQTIEYWRHSTMGYNAGPPGLLVLTNDTNWHVLNADTGMHDPGPFPAGFRARADACLTYFAQTTTGATVLAALEALSNVDLTPGQLGSSFRSTNAGNAQTRVAHEVLGGNPGGEVAFALISSGASPEWLRAFVNNAPLWALDRIPGTGTLRGLRSYLNRWALLVDPRYLRNADSNEGYSRDELWFPQLGDATGLDPRLTLTEVNQWLAGNALPARLTVNQSNQAKLSLIAALDQSSRPGAGSGAHVFWNDTPTNPLNATRPPAIGLAHELIHAYFSTQGRQPGADDGAFHELTEYKCVGLGPWDEAPVSENRVRAEWWPLAGPHIPAADVQNRKAVPKRISYT